MRRIRGGSVRPAVQFSQSHRLYQNPFFFFFFFNRKRSKSLELRTHGCKRLQNGYLIPSAISKLDIDNNKTKQKVKFNSNLE